MKVNVRCCICPEMISFDIPDKLLNGFWIRTNNQLWIDDAFCSKHSKIRHFIENQCSGCVGGWLECDLWKSFTYTKLTLTEKDFELLRKGICPKRTNSMFAYYKNGKIEEIDVSSVDSKSIEGGKILADAIIEYRKIYSDVNRS